MDDGAEGGGVEGLRDVPDRAELVAVQVVRLLGARRQEDDRQLARGLVTAQLAGDLPAVEVRHHHVEQDEVGQQLSRQLERLLAVARLDRVHPLEAQVDAAEQPDRGLVVDDQHERTLPRLGRRLGAVPGCLGETEHDLRPRGFLSEPPGFKCEFEHWRHSFCGRVTAVPRS